jgi:LmbE family N-acetylglucosaminyl deacetylase
VNVVSIMAHQDDEMRCLGTMLKCRARGDRLWFITLTDGSKGMVQTPEMAREDAARIRMAEMQALAAEVGADYDSLGEPDEFLYDTPDVRMRLIEVIRRSGADIIFTHYHENYNLDHIAVNLLVRQCAMQSRLPVLPTASPPLAQHPAIFMVEPHGPIVFPACYYVDIGAFQAEKARLLRHHASQEVALQRGVGSGLGDLSLRLAAYRGDQVAASMPRPSCPWPRGVPSSRTRCCHEAPLSGGRYAGYRVSAA